MAGLKELEKKFNELSKKFKKDVLAVMEVEGLRFIKSNFESEGFQGESLEKWQERKTTDKRGRDITRYRTNKVGRIGTLNKYGRSNQGGPILTGNDTGGDKLRNSFSAYKKRKAVVFRTYKIYAKRHNEGLDGMPKRAFMARSPHLDKMIKDKVKQILDQSLK